MKRGEVTEAMKTMPDEYRLEALEFLYQAEVSELISMKMRSTRKIVAVAIAATMVLALGGVVAAKTGVFGTTFKEGAPEETLKYSTLEVDPDTDETVVTEYTVDDASAVVEFDGADVCNAIEYKLGYVPAGATENDDESAEYFGRVFDWNDGHLEFQTSDDKFIKIDTYYDPQFSYGGMLYTSANVVDLEETTFGDYDVYKFWLNESLEIEGYDEDELIDVYEGDEIVDVIVPQHYVDSTTPVIIMHNPEGYIFVIAGQCITMDELTQVAESIEIRKTDRLVEYTEFDGYSFEISSAAG